MGSSTTRQIPDQSGLGPCAELVRRGDPDRFFAALLARPDRRPGLLALYAFSLELARIPELVSEPTLGAIRQQWWHEVLEGLSGQGAAPHPVAQALSPWLEAGLSRAALEGLIEARACDFEEATFKTDADLDRYAGETAGALTLAAAALLRHPDPLPEDEAELARRAGRLWARLGLLRSVGFWARRRRLVMPLERLEACGLEREDVFAAARDGRAIPGLAEAVRDEIAVLRLHLARLRGIVLPVPVRPALCYVGLAPSLLRRLDRRAETLLFTPGAPGSSQRLFHILWTASRGRF